MFGICCPSLNSNVYAQDTEKKDWDKFVLENLRLEIEYPSNWIAEDDTERRGDMSRHFTEDPTPVISFESAEKTLNQPPDLSSEMPESMKERFENMPAAYLTIFTPNEIHYLNNNTMDKSKIDILYNEIRQEFTTPLNRNSDSKIAFENVIDKGVHAEYVTLKGLNQIVWKIDRVERIGDQSWTKDNYLFFYNNSTKSVVEIKYSSDESKFNEYKSIFEHMLNSIKPITLDAEDHSDNE